MEKAVPPQESSRFLRNIPDSIQDGVTVLDREMHIIYVNRVMEQWYSHAMPLAGKKCYAAYHGRSQRCEICPSYETLRTGNPGHEVVPFKMVGSKVDGWLDLYSFPLVDYTTGETHGVIKYVQNVTERKRTEEALRESEDLFRSIVEHSHAGIYMIDDTFRFVYVNDLFCKITGYAREEMVGTDFRAILVEESVGVVCDHYLRRQRGEKVPDQYQIAIIRKDGEKRIAEMTVAVITDAEGKKRTVGQGLDITERKRMEEERERLIVDLRDALDKVKTLSGLLPICASCKKIRNDKGHWEQIEVYVRDRSDAQFTHGLCPDCAKQLYPECYEKK